MPFAFNGTCYQTAAEAFAAFKNMYPSITQDSIITLDNSTVQNSTGLVNFILTHTLIRNGSSFNLRGSFKFTQCAISDNGLSNSEAYSYLDGATIWSFFFGFTILCWVLAKNIGLVLQLIKRH